ncbi:1,4-dihydroxy-6-naphthoate synthase [Taibaiella koreensis]|uniref:1,4-dihydroxy-6-naphthoate synthase n=1 Tax=Taibaiella koreensis TaxID=1268548 RepID=UPI000E59D897|nr:1,4-dihydroxy-6-naphthoate synthase [Taibaiella koreensis]
MTTSPTALQTLTLGFSPCPNDTFIFDAMVNRKMDTGPLQFDYVLEDVETLNQWAFEGKLAITKLSYSTLLQVSDRYALLDSGSALGRGVGPLVIRKAGAAPVQDLGDFLSGARIAIPGINTTANLLFSLAFPKATDKTEVLFSEIEERVLKGEFDCGLVIHESRFTYQQRGLEKLIDMGDWWEQASGSAIPLGGICIRRDIPVETALQVEQMIRESLQYSWKNYPALSGFVTSHAQEMEEEVMRKHINLYVNEYSDSLGTEGRQAVNTLFTKARENGLIRTSLHNIYLA